MFSFYIIELYYTVHELILVHWFSRFGRDQGSNFWYLAMSVKSLSRRDLNLPKCSVGPKYRDPWGCGFNLLEKKSYIMCMGQPYLS